MPENTNGCGQRVHCDDTHNRDERCTLTFLCNTHAPGYHVANHGEQVRIHSATR